MIHGGTEEIKQLVMENKLFGAIQCDLYTDDQRFDEMSPIFRTIEVTFNDIGDHMKRFINDHDLSKNSRRTLVGGMRAKQILIATPLLKWYIENGIQVSNVSLIIEYTPKVFLFFS